MSKAGLLLSALVLLGAACTPQGGTLAGGPQGSPVPIATTDSSPPNNLIISTAGLGTRDVQTQTGQPNITLTVSPGESFLIYATANDPEGVKRVELWGGTDSWDCGGSVNQALIGPPPVAVNDDTSGNSQVYPSRYVAASMTYKTCGGGVYASGHAFFFARGFNYAGAKAQSPSLVVKY
jgi:hypothetical protein